MSSTAKTRKHASIATANARTLSLPLLATLLLVSISAVGTLGVDAQTIIATSISGAPFQYIVTVLMENNGYCEVMTTCGGLGPYETSLAQTYSIAGSCQSDSSCSSGGYTAISHPSEPNYVSLTGGDIFGISGDGNCCWQITSPDIIDRVEAGGLSWQAWAEDASGSGTCSFMPPRAADHFAFLEFSDMNTPARCSHFLSTTSPSDTEFLSALSSASPANYIWLTPNDNDNGHDTGVSGGDSYLSSLVPRILNSNLFKTQKAALFIAYDEGNSNYPTDYIYASWSGPVVKTAYTGTGSYSHYSFLKTLETVWSLQPLTANDAAAASMSEFFNSNGNSNPGSLPTSFTYNPTNPQPNQIVTFSGLASGGTQPYTYYWNFGDGSTESGAQAVHTYPQNGTYTVTLTANDAQGRTGTMSEQLGVGTQPAASSLPFVNLWTLSAVAIAGVTGAVALNMIRARRKRGNVEKDEDLDVSRVRRRRSEEEEEE